MSVPRVSNALARFECARRAPATQPLLRNQPVRARVVARSTARMTPPRIFQPLRDLSGRHPDCIRNDLVRRGDDPS